MRSRLPFVFIIITIVLDSMGIGLIMPVMPDLIREVKGADLADAARWGGFLVFAYAVMQFVFGPVLGNLSDRFGRRPVLLVALAVMTVDYLIMGLAGSIWLLLVGRMIAGITGATQSTASAYMADISEPEKKAQNFGLIGAAFGVGFILGPLIGGFLGEFGARTPFFAAMVLAGMNFLFGLFVLPETVTDHIRRPFEWRRANPFGAFSQVSKVPGLARLAAVFFVYNIAFIVYPAIWAYFTRERFGWDAGMVGISLASFGLAMALVQGWLIRLVIPRLGEHRTVMLGMGLNVLAFIGYVLVTEGWMVFAMIPLAAAGAVTGPALQGIMSRTVSDSAQGELQGVLTSLAAAGMILSPVVMTQVFAWFTSGGAPFYLPGAPFVISAVLVVASTVIFAGRTRLGGRQAA